MTLDGKPLAGAAVVFVPVGGGRESGGITDANGEYFVKYLRDEAGATIGKNRVRITRQQSHDPGSEIVPAKYNRNTTLEREVTSGGNEIDFPLQSQ